MSELALPPLASTAAYPEQAFERPGIIDRVADGLVAPAARRLQARKALDPTIVEATRQFAREAERLSDAGVKKAAAELRLVLRRDGFSVPAVAQSFALIREVAGRALGMRHFDSQIRGGWIILNGMVAEMETGEGKTLTATLPACTAALAGLPVHVITVNDYLTARDAEWMGPIYEMLGLTVGVIGTAGSAGAPRRLRLRRHLLHQQGGHVRLSPRPDRARFAGGPDPALDRARRRDREPVEQAGPPRASSSPSWTRPTAS